MRLHFEEWIKDQRISYRTEELIDEAILCYRAKAYKASLLFSYLSFQNIVKERILLTDAPPGYTPHLWSNIQNELRDDDKWESKIIECIERQRPGSIFRLSEDVKKQYFYWKDRRNDCAHGKDNKIGLSHVETFWLFVESNLSKFWVNGGKESLLERMKIYFDKNLTPPNADPLPIIRDIQYAVDPSDYNEVLEIIFGYTEIIPIIPFYDKAFWIKLLTIDSDFRVHAVNYLKTKKVLILDILIEDPSNLIYFSDDPVFIRSLWKEKKYNINKSPLLINLLRHGHIPSEQFKEFVSNVSPDIDNFLILYQPDETDYRTLEESGFFTEFKLIALENISSFDWTGDNRNLICHLILRYGFDEGMVKAINNAFTGSFTPWKLGDSLEKLFINNPAYKIEYKRINDELHGILPERFFPEES